MTKSILLALWLMAALFLVASLFQMLGITLADVGRMIEAAPAWIFVAVSAITLANLVIGVARWQTAKAWLSPASPPVAFGTLLEATTWGALLGQVTPPQLSMSVARWVAVRNSASVGVTLYEGLFDLVALGSGAIAGIAILELHLGSSASVALFILASLAGCLSVRKAMSAGHLLCRHFSRGGTRGAILAANLADAFERAGSAPVKTLTILSAWSFARVLLLSVRALLVATAFLDHFNGVTVLIGYSVIGLIKGLPVMPAGLGIAEWTWTGLLVLAGAAAPAAAVTAVAFRVVNLAALAAVMLVLLAVRAVRTIASSWRETARRLQSRLKGTMMDGHVHRIPRYTIVAISCALLHNAILIGMDMLGANVFWCQVASAVVLTPVGYFAQSVMTFRSSRTWSEFVKYAAALLTNFPLALFLLWFARDLLFLPMWSAAPFSCAAMFCWNYLTSSWAFSRGGLVAEVPARG